MSDREVAITILNQLGGMRKVVAMTGARNFITSLKGLRFRFPQPSRGPNEVEIRLDPTDTYTVTFNRIVGAKVVEVSKHTDIYNDMLKGLFERETGLYLSF